MSKLTNALIAILALICVVVIVCMVCGINQWYAILAYWVVLLIKNFVDWRCKK